MNSQLNSTLVRKNYDGGRKRIFIGILCATCLVICLLLLGLLILPWLAHSGNYLRYCSIGAGCIGIVLLSWLCLMLVFHIYTGRRLPGISGVRHAMIRLLLPLMEIVGKFCGIDKNLVRRSFIRVNNEFVLSDFKPAPPEKILLLLPHCIQASSCPRRLIFTLDNCANCGKCQIGALRAMAARWGFKIAVATGGTVARRIVVECRPKYIIAVACERDLSSGIQDSYPIPVFGVLNERPNGPCRDTLASMPVLKNALAFFLDKDERELENVSMDIPAK